MARLAERLEGTALAPAQVLPLPSALEGVTPLVHEVLLRIDAWQRQGRFDRLSIIHQRRRRGAHAVPREHQLLPLPARWLRHLGERPWESRSLPAFTMDYRRLLPSLTAIR